MKSARVFIDQSLVGTIKKSNEEISFEYDSAWVSKGYAISLSLPLSGQFDSKTSHSYFSNLLPEGSIRELVCRRLKISADNDWDLLLALGRESAGALTIVESEKETHSRKSYKEISAKQLDDFSRSKSVMPQVMSNESARLSLAGAQDKIAVFFDGKNYFLPVNGAPTNTILKFENEHYKQITVNEVFMTQLAASIGLPTSKCRLYTKSKRPIAVFERFDRVVKEGQLERLHQEDICQSLGVSRKVKYEKEGGPKLIQALNILRDFGTTPAEDRQALIRWQIFNILCGNSDGHGKNISLFCSSNNIRLTPFYDLVCTRVYNSLDRKLAMSFAGNFDPDLFDVKRVELWKAELGVSIKYLKTEIESLINLIEEKISLQREQFESEFGFFGILEQIELFINKQIKKSKKALL